MLELEDNDHNPVPYKRFKVLMAVSAKIMIMCLHRGYHHFGRSCFIHHSPVLKWKAAGSSKTLVPIHQTMEDYILKSPYRYIGPG